MSSPRAKSPSQISLAERGSKLRPDAFCTLPRGRCPSRHVKQGQLHRGEPGGFIGWVRLGGRCLKVQSMCHSRRLGRRRLRKIQSCPGVRLQLSKTHTCLRAGKEGSCARVMLAYLTSPAWRMPLFEKGRWQQLRGWADLLLLRILALVLLGVRIAAVRWALHDRFAGWIKRNLLSTEHITREKTEHSAVQCLWYRWPWLFSQIWSSLSFCPVSHLSDQYCNNSCGGFFLSMGLSIWLSHGSIFYSCFDIFSLVNLVCKHSRGSSCSIDESQSSLCSKLILWCPYHSPKLFTFS